MDLLMISAGVTGGFLIFLFFFWFFHLRPLEKKKIFERLSVVWLSWDFDDKVHESWDLFFPIMELHHQHEVRGEADLYDIYTFRRGVRGSEALEWLLLYKQRKDVAGKFEILVDRGKEPPDAGEGGWQATPAELSAKILPHLQAYENFLKKHRYAVEARAYKDKLYRAFRELGKLA